MRLKDITKEWALEQLQAKYEEFNNVFIKSDYKVLKSHPIELSMYDSGLTPGMVAYIAKHANPDIFFKCSLHVRRDSGEELSAVRDAYKRLYKIYSDIFWKYVDTDKLSREDYHEYFETAAVDKAQLEFHYFFDDNAYYQIAQLCTKFTQVNDSTLRLSFVHHDETNEVPFDDRIISVLSDLRDSITRSFEYVTEHDRKDLLSVCNESLEVFNVLNNYVVKSLKAINTDAFAQQEFDICDFDVDEQELKEIIDRFDNIPRLRVSEVLDPMHIKAWLTTAPSELIKNLTDLCDSTVVKKITPKNETLPNVVTLKDAVASCWVNDESQNANAFARSLLVNINRRIEYAEPRSKEKRTLRKFKESITSYIHQLYAIYNTILPYTMQSRYSRPSHLVINAIETDMKNGNHDEKLKIIDELTRSVDLIKQSAESIDAACHDALFNAYNE